MPGCGTFIGVLWSLFITIVGLYSIHETDPELRTMAVFQPLRDLKEQDSPAGFGD